MTIGRIIGFAISSILVGIGVSIGTRIVKKAEEHLKNLAEENKALKETMAETPPAESVQT